LIDKDLSVKPRGTPRGFFVPALKEIAFRAGDAGTTLQGKSNRKKFNKPVQGRMAQGGAKRVPPKVGEWFKATSRIPFVL